MTQFSIFTVPIVKGDFADIRTHYGPGPSAFWVAEVTNGSAAGTIIGFVGLGVLPSPKLSNIFQRLTDIIFATQIQK